MLTLHAPHRIGERLSALQNYNVGGFEAILGRYLEQTMNHGVEFVKPVTSTTGSVIAVLDDTCGNLIQLTKLSWG